jgi:hypothetical protein
MIEVWEGRVRGVWEMHRSNLRPREAKKSMVGVSMALKP